MLVADVGTAESARRTTATILAVRDLEVLVIRVLLDALDGLDLQVQVRTRASVTVESSEAGGEPWAGDIDTHGIGDVRKVDKRALLLLEEVDELDLAVLAKVGPQFLVRVRLKVLYAADVDIARASGLDDHRDTRRSRTRLFTLSWSQEEVSLATGCLEKDDGVPIRL